MNSVHRPFLVFVLLLALPFVQGLGMVHRVLHEPHGHQAPAHFYQQDRGHSHVHSHNDEHDHLHEPDAVASSQSLFSHESEGDLECQLFDEATGASAVPSLPCIAVLAPNRPQVVKLNLLVVASSFYSINQARGPPYLA